MRSALFAIAMIFGFAGPATVAHAQSFSDKELISGFMRTVFGSENFWVASAAKNRVSKFAKPVRVQIVDLAGSRKSAKVRRFISTVDRSIDPLRISTTSSPRRANYTVYLLRRADYGRVVRETLPDVRTGFLERAACSGIAFLTPGGAISNAIAFVVTDEGDAMFRHCLVEEFLQGLGPSNDSPRLVHSIFNDRSAAEEFLPFDRYLMNMLYDPRITPGMTRSQVRTLLPLIIRDLRPRLG